MSRSQFNHRIFTIAGGPTGVLIRARLRLHYRDTGALVGGGDNKLIGIHKTKTRRGSEWVSGRPMVIEVGRAGGGGN